MYKPQFLHLYYLNHNGEIWHEGADMGHSPQAKFGKNRLRGYTPIGKIIPKISNFGYFGDVSPHFKSDNGEIWHEVWAWNFLSHTKFCKIGLRGYTSFGQIYTKN